MFYPSKRALSCVCTISNVFFSHFPDSLLGQANLYINKSLTNAMQLLGLSFWEEEEGWWGTKYLRFRKTVMIFFFSPQLVKLMCPARKTPELLCFYISDRVNHHLFYQKLLISLQYAILTGFGTFLSISTPSFSKYFFMKPCQNL